MWDIELQSKINAYISGFYTTLQILSPPYAKIKLNVCQAYGVDLTIAIHIPTPRGRATYTASLLETTHLFQTFRGDFEWLGRHKAHRLISGVKFSN